MSKNVKDSPSYYMLPVETVLKFIDNADSDLLALVRNCTKVTYKGFEITYRHDVGMFSLTSVWKACGSPGSKNPKYWLRYEGTREYFRELLKDSFPIKLQNQSQGDYNHLEKTRPDYDSLYITSHGGSGEFSRQTYGTWEVLIAYLMYLDAKITKEVVKLFKEYLTDKANLAIKIYKKLSTKDREFLEARTIGKESRLAFTDKLQAYSEKPNDSMMFARCTNAIYKGLFGMDSQCILVTFLEPSNENPRDFLHINCIRILMTIESNIAQILDSFAGRKLSIAELEHICFDYSNKYKESMKQIGTPVVLRKNDIAS